MAETDDGSLIGGGGWTTWEAGSDAKPNQRQGRCHIRHFACDPDYLGKGVGRRLFEACIEDARGQAYSLFAVYSSLNAEASYAGMGFQRVKPVSVALSQDIEFPAVLMHMDL